MRLAIVSTHPPGKGSLTEYGFHFILALRTKTDLLQEMILLVDELPDRQEAYTFDQDASLVPVRVETCWRFNAWDNTFRILKALRAAKPDIVFFNIQFASFGAQKIPAALGLFAPFLARLAGFKTVVLLHNIMDTVDLKQAGFGGNPLMELAIRTFGNLVTRLILSANLVAVTIPKYVGLLEQKYKANNVLLAPHGSFQDSKGEAPRAPDGPPGIMTFGKFGTYKKVEILIEAFERLLPEFPDAQLVIAGTDNPNVTGYLDGVKQQYRHVPNVEFTGYVAEEDVPALFDKAWVVAFPYTSTTGSSGVLHQAGGFGRAVVLPRLGDLEELVIEEGYDGEFFDPQNPDSLADAIRRVIKNPQRMLEISSKNYLAANGLPIAEVADWYLIHFENLLNPRSRT